MYCISNLEIHLQFRFSSELVLAFWNPWYQILLEVELPFEGSFASEFAKDVDFCFLSDFC